MDLTGKRWSAARLLFEKYAAPLPVIAAVGGWSENTLHRLSVEQNWTAGPGVPALSAQLSKVFEVLLTRMKSQEAGFAEDEKAARTLIAMGKALESLATIDGKSEASHAFLRVDRDKKTSKSSNKKEPLNADNVQSLNRELETLIERLEAEEETTARCANS